MSRASPLAVSFVVDASHPSLPGHFPGMPIVPGVVLLDRLVDLTERALGANVHVRSIHQVKFLHPLLPEETASAILELDGAGTMRFQVERGSVVIARGSLGVQIGVLP